MQTNQPQPLSSQAIDQIFAQLHVVWGRNFLAQYEGQDLSVIKANWANTLAGLQRRPYAIAYAIENLPPMRMNALEFRDLCRRAPEPVQNRLPPPPIDKARAREALNAARQALNTDKDPLDWARKLQARDQAGERLTLAQRESYRTALKSDIRPLP